MIVTEIFDSELLGEGLLPSLRDACARLLAPGGAVIPARAVLWGQLVESSVLRRSTVSTLPLPPWLLVSVTLGDSAPDTGASGDMAALVVAS